jgi:hypothetical protein
MPGSRPTSAGFVVVAGAVVVAGIVVVVVVVVVDSGVVGAIVVGAIVVVVGGAKTVPDRYTITIISTIKAIPYIASYP